MLLCLTAVCLFCSGILGVVYAVTYNPILEASHKALVASISEVLPEGGEMSEALSADSFEYYSSTKDGEVLAYAVKSTAIGFGGPLTVMVGVLPDGTVYATKVLSHSETPGLGAKCQNDEKFLSQFRGFAADKTLLVTKDGGDVDAITASTITSRAYTLAVANAVAFVKGMSVATNEEGGNDNE